MKKVTLITALFMMSFNSFGQDSLNISVLYHWDDSTLVYNEVWGFVENGREYAVIGSWDGTHFFDVTDPQNTVKVDYVPGTVTVCSPYPCIHRDYHDYNGYLYMVTDEDTLSTLQIVDLGTLPDSVTLVYESNTLFSRSHNIFIDPAAGRLYDCGGDPSNNGIRIFSLANPENPFEIANLSVPGGYVHDMFVRNDTAFLNIGGNGLYVYDYSDLGNPILLGSMPSVLSPDSINPAYNHAGWLTADGNTYVLAYETTGVDVYVLDVSNLSNITVLDSVNSGGDSLSIPHNPIILGDYAYISYYHDGVYIYDISNPAVTTVAGYYDTKSQPGTGGGAWGVYPLLPSGILLVSDMGTGLWVLDPTNAVATAPVASFTFNDFGGGVVNFTDASSNLPTSWAWNFDDGNTSTQQNPSHTYAAIGQSYNVCLTAINAIGNDSTCNTVDVADTSSSTGIQNNALASGLSVFPNPFSDELNISIPTEAGTPLSFKIYDTTGREIEGGTLNKSAGLNIRTKSLDAGMYVLQIHTQRGTYTTKISKISSK